MTSAIDPSSSATGTSDIYTLSLHDALPIYHAEIERVMRRQAAETEQCHADRNVRELGELAHFLHRAALQDAMPGENRSEEHTSELQSQSNLVCRPLLEKKNLSPPFLPRSS